jgi:hypothetical protein
MLDQLDPVFTCLSFWVQKSQSPVILGSEPEAWAKGFGLHGTTEFTITRDDMLGLIIWSTP